MEGIVHSLRLGWRALLLKEEAYQEMKASSNPVVKGLVLIIVVGAVIALVGLVGTVLEWASTPDLQEIKDTVHAYLLDMPWWDEMPPQALEQFEQWYELGWRVFPSLFGAPNIGSAALGIITMPVGLVIRWLIYGLLAYLFARWLGGTANLSETLGVLALAVAPQAVNILRLFPFVQAGNLVAVWGILCAYVGLKTAHKLSWERAVWATVLPFLLVMVVAALTGCLVSALIAVAVKGG